MKQAPRPAPRRPRDAALRQQQKDFSDEGSPLPGLVGRQPPLRESDDADPAAEAVDTPEAAESAVDAARKRAPRRR